jgi:hypothetical protein
LLAAVAPEHEAALTGAGFHRVGEVVDSVASVELTA